MELRSGRALPSNGMIGRAGDLSRLVGLVASHMSRGVLLVGEAGVGKTTLAREVRQYFDLEGWATVWIAASPASTTIPLGAMAHLWRGRVTTRGETFSTVVSHLQALADGRRVMEVVDDAHDLDDASAALLHHVASTGAATLVATLRAHSPAAEAITALWKDGLCERLELAPISRDDTSGVAEALLGGPVDDCTLDSLWQRCRGNVLYLRELVAGGRATGALVESRGMWVWRSPVEVAPRLIELVADRIDRQPAAVLDLVDVVSFGEPLSLSALGRLGIPTRVVEAAERLGFVATRAGDGGGDIVVGLGHPMIGEVMRARATALHHREVCRRLVGCADSDEPAQQMRSAVWHLEGELSARPGLLTDAAVRALGMMDMALAQRLARAAIRSGDGWPAHQTLASLLVLTGGADEAEILLATLSRTELPDESRALAVAERATNLTFGLHRPAEAHRLLDELAASGPGRGVALARKAMLLSHAGLFREAHATADHALAAGTGTIARAEALLAQGQALTVSGRSISAIRAARQALVALDEASDEWSMLRDEVSGMLVVARVHAGHLHEVARLIRVGRARTSMAGWRIGSAMWMWFEADLLYHRGQLADSLNLAQRALPLLTDDRHPYRCLCLRLLHMMVARSAAQLGDTSEASEALANADRCRGDEDGTGDHWGDSARAWISVSSGQPRKAVDELLQDMADARSRGLATAEVAMLHQLARLAQVAPGVNSLLGDPSGLGVRLEILSGVVEGDLAPLQLRHCRAMPTGMGSDLDEVAEGFGRLGFALFAAEAAAQASMAHRRSGLKSSAVAASVRARLWAAQCGGAASATLRRLGSPVPLTPREHEIAVMAAAGLTSRSIAVTLVVSVRTVENTLSHVYSKTGVSKRVDLAAVLGIINGEDPAAVRWPR